MPLDAIFISELCRELRDDLTGMKIDRVHQPERDTVLLSLRGNGASRKLLLCFGSGAARVCLTERVYENPPQPPMFCMLLRKHLTGARIVEISQPEGERMLLFRLAAYDEFGEPTDKALAMELLGRNANLILIDGEGRILDAARRVDEEMSPLRQLLPGLVYRLPPKPEPGKFSGLSPLLRREMEWRGLPQTPEGLEGLERRPYMLVESGAPKDFTFLPILQYGPAVESVAYPGWSALLDAFYGEKDRLEHLKSRARSMTKLVRGAKNRTERKLSLRIQELEATAGREEDKRRGDLITANIWRMKPGMESVTLEDFYDPDCPEITIPLDPRKSPQQNAAAYYKQYTKKKTAQAHLTGLIEENRREAEYLASIAAELERVQSQADLDGIREEMTQAGYLRPQRENPKKRPKPAQPMRFHTSGGFEVLVGRNNLQNDELTLRTARRTDLWLHVQKLHGAHVILRCEGAQPDEESVYQAACLAAFYSEGAQAGRVPVDVTEARFVKKPHGARPGMVVYTGQKTIMAEPKKEI
ncbi:MAG: NFACT family protein [Oscillospiraceae bacterium]|nr:NFACT family protein [Oscillospiraceae bacterium]